MGPVQPEGYINGDLTFLAANIKDIWLHQSANVYSRSIKNEIMISLRSGQQPKKAPMVYITQFI